MGFKETNYGKFTDWKNQDYKLTEETETFGIMDSDPTRYFEFEDILIKAQEENDSEGMEKAALMFTLLSVKQLVKRIPNNTKVIDIQNNIRLKFSNLYPALIFPVTQSLKEEGYIIDENTTFNTDEAIKYIDRVLDKGEYTDTPQGRRYKLLAFKRMFNLSDKKYSKDDVMVFNKDIINNDFSVRQDLLLEVMGQYGDKKNPVTISNRNITISKIGVACDDQDKILFDFLLGQFVENGGEKTKIVLRSDMLEALNFDGKGDRFDFIKKSLGAIATQVIFIDDEKNSDKVTKQIRKNISEKGRHNLKSVGANLLNFKYIEIEGELAIEFDIPLMKVFCAHKQFDRIISNEVLRHWLQNPRIYWITRELSALIRNKNLQTLKIETLLKNIGEWERYKSYSNKRIYLQRLNKDIDIAISYLSKGAISYNKCSPSTLKQSYLYAKR